MGYQHELFELFKAIQFILKKWNKNVKKSDMYNFKTAKIIRQTWKGGVLIHD